MFSWRSDAFSQTSAIPFEYWPLDKVHTAITVCLKAPTQSMKCSRSTQVGLGNSLNVFLRLRQMSHSFLSMPTVSGGLRGYSRYFADWASIGFDHCALLRSSRHNGVDPRRLYILFSKALCLCQSVPQENTQDPQSRNRFAGLRCVNNILFSQVSHIQTQVMACGERPCRCPVSTSTTKS